MKLVIEKFQGNIKVSILNVFMILGGVNRKMDFKMHISYVNQRKYCLFSVVHMIKKERGKK